MTTSATIDEVETSESNIATKKKFNEWGASFDNDQIHNAVLPHDYPCIDCGYLSIICCNLWFEKFNTVFVWGFPCRAKDAEIY